MEAYYTIININAERFVKRFLYCGHNSCKCSCQLLIAALIIMPLMSHMFCVDFRFNSSEGA